MENNHTMDSTAPVKCTLMSNSIKYGLFTGIAMILVALLLYTFDLNGASWAQYGSMLVLFAGIIVGTIAFRDKCNQGFLSYGRSLGSGVLISLGAGILLAIYTYLFLAFFDPAQIMQMAQVAEEKLMEQGLSDEQIDQALSMTKMFMTPASIAVTSIFSMLLWGTLFSLLASIFVKKDNKNFEQVFADVEN